jgi:hypothetical protein
MKQWFKKIVGIDKLEQELKIAKGLETKPTGKKDPKAIATKAKEPYVEITHMEIDSENPSYGSFELDWNEHFIKKLRAMGYPGETDEVVVDLWFQSVCRNILMETYEQDAASKSADNIRYINRKDLGGGKTEVS